MARPELAARLRGSQQGGEGWRKKGGLDSQTRVPLKGSFKGFHIGYKEGSVI